MKCDYCGSKLIFSDSSKSGRVVYVNCPKCGRVDAFVVSERAKENKDRLRA